MKEFDYIIIGGGCAGLSLAYELEIHEKLRDKTLAIIEPRQEYKKDKLSSSRLPWVCRSFLQKLTSKNCKIGF